jgi:DNA-binding MarR family transcriptional regulator
MLALLQTAHEWFVQGLSARVAQAGFADVTAPQLVLFAHLECGASHASAVAQRMGVSRQAVYRTVRDMQALGLLRLENDAERRNQKLIVMTERGEALAQAGRTALSELEARLASRIGAGSASGLRAALEAGWGDAD